MPPAVSPSRPAPECVPQPRLEVEVMLADQLDYVVGVDPHRDSHALAVVQVVSGAVLFEAAVPASSDGYANALKLVDQHAPGRRAFAVEGTASFGAVLTRFLTGRGELRPLTRARLLQRLAATRPGGGRDPELRGSMLALRSIARRVLQLTAEERELACEIEALTRKLAPQLLDQPGVGPHAAAQLVLSWSHRGRIESEAAFARLAGAAPIPASSGQTIRYRLDRSGDRKLNRALHMILVTRKRSHPATIAYIERRLQEGKSRREANRCLKRYLVRGFKT